MITDIEQETTDFDWFFTNGQYVAYAASGGGKLPDSVAKSGENLALLSDYFEGLEETHKVIISDGYKKETDMYLSGFVHMAALGLFAFDKTAPCRFFDTSYHLVAKPAHPILITDLPPHIAEILMQTRFEGDIPSILSSSVIP